MCVFFVLEQLAVNSCDRRNCGGRLVDVTILGLHDRVTWEHRDSYRRRGFWPQNLWRRLRCRLRGDNNERHLPAIVDVLIVIIVIVVVVVDVVVIICFRLRLRRRVIPKPSLRNINTTAIATAAIAITTTTSRATTTAELLAPHVVTTAIA